MEIENREKSHQRQIFSQ